MSHIKNLITQYQKTGCESYFNEIYEMFAGKVFNFARKQTRQRRLIWQDVESEANQVFYKAVVTYDERIGEFEPFLFLMLRRHIANVGSKSLTYQTYVERYMHSAKTSTDNEPEIIAIKKEQRQLLNELTANATIPSRQALVAFAKSYSFRKAAKQLGTSDKTVKNRIEKIAAARRHISLDDYFTA